MSLLASTTLSIGLSILIAGSTWAEAFEVSGELVLELPGSGGQGIRINQPFTTASDFDGSVHSLAASLVGIETEASGLVDSGLYRLPYYDRVALGASVIRSGILTTSGGMSGLELDVVSFELSGADVYVNQVYDQTDGETVHFDAILLGSGPQSHTGVLSETHSEIGTATLVSDSWSVDKNELTQGGVGDVELVAPITLSSSVQSGEDVTGTLRISLVFLPEPSVVLGLMVGAAALAFRQHPGSRLRCASSSTASTA